MSLRRKYLTMAAIAFILLFLITANQKEGLYFSHGSGFYDSDFQLEILSDYDYDIFYTLDGSDPTPDSIPYTSPIRISDASKNDNVYSMRTDVSVGFCIGLTDDPPSSRSMYSVPDYLLDKCTIVRAAAFFNGEQISALSASYFVGFENKSNYDNMYIVSVITDPENLFDYETGIYVLGKKFDDFLSDKDNLKSRAWYAWSANYGLSRRESERPAFAQIYSPDKELIFSTNCGLRVQGNASRASLPRSLGLFSRNEYARSEIFPSGLFDNGLQPHKIALAAGGNENMTKIRDPLVNTLCQDLNFSTMDFLPCVLFLDGEFWGTYYLTETYNARYIHEHYGIPESDVILAKNHAISEGEPDEIDVYRSMCDFIAETDMTLEENYAQACALIDMDSYIDYYASQIYIARRNDWPTSNWAAWRSRSAAKNHKFQDGRWRWMVFDANGYCIATERITDDSLAYAMAEDPMFCSLCKNEGFRHAFAERIRFIATEIYSSERVDPFVDSYLETMLEPLTASAKRFTGDEMRQYIIDHAEMVRDFFYQRVNYVDSMIAANFGEGY